MPDSFDPSEELPDLRAFSLAYQTASAEGKSSLLGEFLKSTYNNCEKPGIVSQALRTLEHLEDDGAILAAASLASSVNPSGPSPSGDISSSQRDLKSVEYLLDFCERFARQVQQDDVHYSPLLVTQNYALKAALWATFPGEFLHPELESQTSENRRASRDMLERLDQSEILTELVAGGGKLSKLFDYMSNSAEFYHNTSEPDRKNLVYELMLSTHREAFKPLRASVRVKVNETTGMVHDIERRL